MHKVEGNFIVQFQQTKQIHAYSTFTCTYEQFSHGDVVSKTFKVGLSLRLLLNFAFAI